MIPPKRDSSKNSLTIIRCRYCKGQHWTNNCPNKDIYEQLECQKIVVDGSSNVDSSTQASSGTDCAYIPPSKRAGAAQNAENLSSTWKYEPKYGQKEEFKIRVTNLPEEATENDITELFQPFGNVFRVLLVKDKNTQQSRRFAFVSFLHKDDAQRAIIGVDYYGYHHLILKVEWAKL